MRLSEVILTKVNPSKSYSGEFKEPYYPPIEKEDPTNIDKGVMGRGLYSTVKPDRDDEQSIVKYQHSPTYLREASYLYAEYVMENQLWTNPYFPRFYELDTYEDKTGRKIHKLKMERLNRASSLSVEDIEAIMNIAFTDDAINSVMMKLRSMDPESSDYVNVMFIGVVSTIRASYKNSTYQESFIKSQVLDNAITNLRMAHEYIEEETHSKVIYDMHAANFLVRRGPHTPQLVFADPFVVGDYS